MQHFDFDDWAALAAKHPAAFEQRRRTVVTAFIAAQTHPRRARLERLQWRIDRERERAGTPLGACIRLSHMMWDQFAGPGGLAERLNTAAGHQPPPPPRPAATVISLRRSRDD